MEDKLCRISEAELEEGPFIHYISICFQNVLLARCAWPSDSRGKWKPISCRGAPSVPSVKSYYRCRYASPVTSNPIGAERNRWCLLANQLHDCRGVRWWVAWSTRGERDDTVDTEAGQTRKQRKEDRPPGRTMADGELIHLHNGTRSHNFLMESGAMGDALFEKVTVRDVWVGSEKTASAAKEQTDVTPVSKHPQLWLNSCAHYHHIRAITQLISLKKHICFDCGGDVVKFESDTVNIIKRKILSHVVLFIASSFHLRADSSVA